MDGTNEGMSGPVRAATGEWSGWLYWPEGDPFELQSGPFYFRQDDQGAYHCAFRAEPKHMNGGGFIHGGCLMTFADYALFVIARDELANSHSVTVTLNGEYVGPAHVGDLVEARGEVVKAGRSMVFIRGLISTSGRPLMSFSGVVKKTAPRTTG